MLQLLPQPYDDDAWLIKVQQAIDTGPHYPQLHPFYNLFLISSAAPFTLPLASLAAPLASPLSSLAFPLASPFSSAALPLASLSEMSWAVSLTLPVTVSVIVC
jgi:hypothetical protein